MADAQLTRDVHVPVPERATLPPGPDDYGASAFEQTIHERARELTRGGAPSAEALQRAEWDVRLARLAMLFRVRDSRDASKPLKVPADDQ